MTLALLDDLNIQTSFKGNIITVFPKKKSTKEMVVESD
jgi:3-phosphoshikimate 1-carboxyvinyltransferase